MMLRPLALVALALIFAVPAKGEVQIVPKEAIPVQRVAPPTVGGIVGACLSPSRLGGCERMAQQQLSVLLASDPSVATKPEFWAGYIKGLRWWVDAPLPGEDFLEWSSQHLSSALDRPRLVLREFDDSHCRLSLADCRRRNAEFWADVQKTVREHFEQIKGCGSCAVDAARLLPLGEARRRLAEIR